MIRRAAYGSAGIGSGRRLGGGVSRRHGRCDLTRKHRSHKLQGHIENPGSGGRVNEARDCSEDRSEEHTSELQSRPHLVCRLLLEKKTVTNRSHFTPSKREKSLHAVVSL